MCVCVFIEYLLHPLCTSLLGTGGVRRDSTFVTYMNLTLLLVENSVTLGMLIKKLKMEVTSRVEWEEDVVGEDTQQALNILVMFLFFFFLF